MSVLVADGAVLRAAMVTPIHAGGNAELVARIERLPVTPRLLLLRVIVGIATFFDAYTVLAIAFAMPQLVSEWKLAPAEVGMIISAGYVGQLFGAVLFGSQLWAAHGESGLFAWDLDKPGHPAIAIRPASSSIASLSPRNLCVLNGTRLLFSSDRRLMEATADGQIQIIDASAAPIVALIPSLGKDLLVVHEDGQICRRDGTTLTVIARSHRTGRVSAAGAMPWLGSVRLLVASEQPSLLCLGMDDEWVTQYVTTHIGLRQATASADRVAAVNADRQRILLWPSWDGRKPPTEIHIAALARHRVADIEFA